MKNYMIIIIALLGYNFSIAQIVDIPDSSFKTILVNAPCVDTDNDGFVDDDVDTNDDGEIQVTEAEAVDNLVIYSNNIESIVGIQSFVNLRDLNLNENPIEVLDLSQNIQLEELSFGGVLISSIDLSQNINLKELGVGGSEMTAIDLSHNIQLEKFTTGFNMLIDINLSQNVNLKILHLIYMDDLTSIDITNNPNLEEVVVYNNALTSLDVSNNPNIVWLDFANNQITSIDLNQNVSLEQIDFANNQLTGLDVSENPNIFRINCENNQLTSLNIKNGNINGIARLMAFGNPDLSCIQVDDVAYANSQICDGSNDGNWCKDETAIYSEDCSLGITELNLHDAIQLYPNPVKNILQISTKNNVAIKSVQVYDVLGKQLVQAKKINQLDVSSLASGLLFVKVETENGFVVKKVVKE